MNQEVLSGSSVRFESVDTGLGANELHPMDQPVTSSSEVVFSKVNIGGSFFLSSTPKRADLNTDMLAAPLLPEFIGVKVAQSGSTQSIQELWTPLVSIVFVA